MNNPKQVITPLALVIIVITAALIGTLVGGGAVYLAVSDRLSAPSAQTPIETGTEIPVHVEAQTVRTVDVRTAVTNAVAKVGPAVVTVINHLSTGGFNPFFGQLDSDPRASGSGVFISSEGYVTTNNHVVRGSKSLEVILRDGRTISAELIGTDAFADLAVLKVADPPPAAAEFGNSDMLKPGETVIAIGSPLGEFQNTVTVGVVSATGRSLLTGEAYQMEDLVQTDAAINRGNSGGPLVNLAGQVIGINTLIVRGAGISGDMAEGLGFAIGSNTVKAISDQLIAQGYVTRPFLGIQWQLVTPDVARRYRLPVRWGIYITHLMRDEPAEEAGLREGDIITKLGSDEIDENRPFINLLLRHKPGERLEISYVRDGQTRTTTVTLGTRAQS
ncbi:MAG: S1C family serine protease [Candidatus Binatia bacterium]